MFILFSCINYLLVIFSELNAFVYDGTVLEYLVGQDEECKLLTVGSWYAMTGYAAAFPRNSKHFINFNRKIMDYSENGKKKYLKRLAWESFKTAEERINMYNKYADMQYCQHS